MRHLRDSVQHSREHGGLQARQSVARENQRLPASTARQVTLLVAWACRSTRDRREGVGPSGLAVLAGGIFSIDFG